MTALRPLLPAALLAAALLVSAAACDVPGGEPRLADTTLVDVLTELHLADARARLPGGSEPGLRDSVLSRYGLDSASFSRVMAPYVEEPERLVALYNSVLDRLSATRPGE